MAGARRGVVLDGRRVILAASGTREDGGGVVVARRPAVVADVEKAVEKVTTRVHVDGILDVTTLKLVWVPAVNNDKVKNLRLVTLAQQVGHGLYGNALEVLVSTTHEG